MADKAEMSSMEKAAARDAKSAARQAAFDKLPIFIQFLIGLAILIVIAIIGFTALWLLGFGILDFDPVGRLLGLTR